MVEVRVMVVEVMVKMVTPLFKRAKHTHTVCLLVIPPGWVELCALDGGGEAHDRLEWLGPLLLETLLRIVDVHHSAICAARHVLAIGRDGDSGTNDTAIVDKAVDAVARGHVPDIDLPITCMIGRKMKRRM